MEYVQTPLREAFFEPKRPAAVLSRDPLAVQARGTPKADSTEKSSSDYEAKRQC